MQPYRSALSRRDAGRHTPQMKKAPKRLFHLPFAERRRISHSIVDRQENPVYINITFEEEQPDAMKNTMPSSPGAG
ncbi:hypothetical protein ACOTF1_16420 [Achromobacter ruhlandii]|uniref:hypothetical protein n=1 Tax=Achromobacter ruhlandii TaxID=72557 RepID=UPI003B9C59C5